MFLLVGGDLEVGGATFRALSARGIPVAATTRRPDHAAPDRPLLDLAAPLGTWEPPPGTRAACIFAAVARLATCASDPKGSAHINVTQTLALIERLLAHGIYVLFLSTNQVFDGETPHVASEAPYAPVSEYGRQKARTEAALRAHLERGAPAAILRLSKVVSPDMPLVRGWADALVGGKPVRGFRDMMLAPVPTGMIVEAIAVLLNERANGIYQLTGPRDVSYVEVARHVARLLGAAPELVTETSATEAGLPEGATPRHTTLNSSRLTQRYGLNPPDVWTVIETVVATAGRCDTNNGISHAAGAVLRS